MRNSLSTPHEYDLGCELEPGKHVLSIRVDNTVKINVGRNAHSVSDHTQTNWNGIVGDMLLKATDPVWIEYVEIHPDPEFKVAIVDVTLGNATGGDGGGAPQPGGQGLGRWLAVHHHVENHGV